jgi:hypothetical protein
MSFQSDVIRKQIELTQVPQEDLRFMVFDLQNNSSLAARVKDDAHIYRNLAIAAAGIGIVVTGILATLGVLTHNVNLEMAAVGTGVLGGFATTYFIAKWLNNKERQQDYTVLQEIYAEGRDESPTLLKMAGLVPFLFLIGAASVTINFGVIPGNLGYVGLGGGFTLFLGAAGIITTRGWQHYNDIDAVQKDIERLAAEPAIQYHEEQPPQN